MGKEKSMPKQITLRINEANKEDKAIADFWLNTEGSRKTQEAKSMMLLGIGIKKFFPNLTTEEMVGNILAQFLMVMSSGKTLETSVAVVEKKSTLENKKATQKRASSLLKGKIK